MKIKNWKKFQHFKDRKPPWVKLYRDLLDDIEWFELDPKAAKVLVMLWLIASEDEGNIPPVKQLAFRLRIPEKETEVCILKLSHWLEHDDINSISEQHQHDAPETERETETKKEKESDERVKQNRGSRLQADFCLTDDWKEFCRAERSDLDPQKVFDGFKDYWIAKAGQQGVKLDWFATWRNWVRNQKQGLVNKADQVFTTVPSKFERDPALLAVEAKFKEAVPMPPEIRAAMERLRK